MNCTENSKNGYISVSVFVFVYSVFEMLKFYLSVYGEITNENALNCTFRYTLLGFPSFLQLLINSQQVCVLCVYVCVCLYSAICVKAQHDSLDLRYISMPKAARRVAAL